MAKLPMTTTTLESIDTQNTKTKKFISPIKDNKPGNKIVPLINDNIIPNDSPVTQIIKINYEEQTQTPNLTPSSSDNLRKSQRTSPFQTSERDSSFGPNSANSHGETGNLVINIEKDDNGLNSNLLDMKDFSLKTTNKSKFILGLESYHYITPLIFCKKPESFPSYKKAFINCCCYLIFSFCVTLLVDQATFSSVEILKILYIVGLMLLCSFAITLFICYTNYLRSRHNIEQQELIENEILPENEQSVREIRAKIRLSLYAMQIGFFGEMIQGILFILACACFFLNLYCIYLLENTQALIAIIGIFIGFLLDVLLFRNLLILLFVWISKCASTTILSDNRSGELENQTLIRKNMKRLKITEKSINSNSSQKFNKGTFNKTNLHDPNALESSDEIESDKADRQNPIDEEEELENSVKKRFGHKSKISTKKLRNDKGEIFTISETSENEDSKILTKKADENNNSQRTTPIKKRLENEFSESKITEKSENDIKSSSSKNAQEEEQKIDRIILEENLDDDAMLMNEAHNTHKKSHNLTGEGDDPRNQYDDNETADTKNLNQSEKHRNRGGRGTNGVNGISGIGETENSQESLSLLRTTLTKKDNENNKHEKSDPKINKNGANAFLINGKNDKKNTLSNSPSNQQKKPKTNDQKGYNRLKDKNILSGSDIQEESNDDDNDNNKNSKINEEHEDIQAEGDGKKDIYVINQDQSNNPNQQGKSPNQQGKSPNQQGKSPNQQGKSPNQQGKSPNQQGKSPNQQGKNPNKQGKSNGPNNQNRQGNNPNQQGKSNTGKNPNQQRKANTSNKQDKPYSPNNQDKSNQLNSSNQLNNSSQMSSSNHLNNNKSNHSNNTNGPNSAKIKNDNSFELVLDKGENFDEKANNTDFRNSSFNSIQMGSSFEKQESDGYDEGLSILELAVNPMPNTDETEPKSSNKNHKNTNTNNNYGEYSIINEEKSKEESIGENKRSKQQSRKGNFNVLENSQEITNQNNHGEIEENSQIGQSRQNSQGRHNNQIGHIDQNSPEPNYQNLSGENEQHDDHNEYEKEDSHQGNEQNNPQGKKQKYPQNLKNQQPKHDHSEITGQNNPELTINNTTNNRKNIKKGKKSTKKPALIERKQSEKRAKDIVGVFSPGLDIKKYIKTRKPDAIIENNPNEGQGVRSKKDINDRSKSLYSNNEAYSTQILSDTKLDGNSKMLSDSIKMSKRNFGKSHRSLSKHKSGGKSPENDNTNPYERSNLHASKWIESQKKSKNSLSNSASISPNRHHHHHDHSHDHSHDHHHHHRHSPKRKKNNSMDDILQTSHNHSKFHHNCLSDHSRLYSYDTISERASKYLKKKKKKKANNKKLKKLNSLEKATTNNNIVILEAENETSIQNDTIESNDRGLSMRFSRIKGLQTSDDSKSYFDTSQNSRFGPLLNRLTDMTRRPAHTKKGDLTQNSHDVSKHINGDSPYLEYLPGMIKNNESILHKIRESHKNAIIEQNENKKKAKIKTMNNIYGIALNKKK